MPHRVKAAFEEWDALLKLGKELREPRANPDCEMPDPSVLDLIRLHGFIWGSDFEGRPMYHCTIQGLCELLAEYGQLTQGKTKGEG